MLSEASLGPGRVVIIYFGSVVAMYAEKREIVRSRQFSWIVNWPSCE